MRSIISLCLFAVTTLAVVACNTGTPNSNRGNANLTTTNQPGTNVAAPQTPTAPAAETGRITVAELRERMAKNDVTIVDVRAAAAYQQSHIKGAINIPLEQVASRAGELPKGKTVVTYCT